MNTQHLATVLRPCSVILAMLVWGAALAPNPAQSQPRDEPVPAATTSTAAGGNKKAVANKKIKKKSARPMFAKDSAETTAERTARLKSECKGAVNAGVCAGYTR